VYKSVADDRPRTQTESGPQLTCDRSRPGGILEGPVELDTPAARSAVLNPTDPESVRDALQLIADENYPGHRGGEFCIRTVLGPVVVGLSPFRRPPPPKALRYAADEDDGLTELERDVIQAVTEGGGEPLTAEVIAERAGYDCNTRLKEALARLVRTGRITRATGRAGYLPAA
jgi:hypothetical protein